MATINKNLQNLTQNDIEEVTERYLLGWHDLMKPYGFRFKGFNTFRVLRGLVPLTPEMSDEYRLAYVREHYSYEEIYDTIREYLSSERVGDTRWEGIELFGCRFGREYARLFKALLGANAYRKIAENARRKKLVETQTEQYGGVGLAGAAAKAKAQATVMNRYGVSNVMQDDGIKQHLFETNMTKYGAVSPFGVQGIRERIVDMRCRTVAEAMRVYKQTGKLDEQMFKQSPQEFAAMYMLAERFGRGNVYWQYGVHPSDARYPYNCDFYIKSADLFIEMNGHYCHGSHWFDPTSPDDALRVKHLLEGGKRGQNAVDVWTRTDVMKRATAKASGIRYLVFWDGQTRKVKNTFEPRLSDFRCWLYEYNANYDKFVKDFPQNTY